MCPQPFDCLNELIGSINQFIYCNSEETQNHNTGIIAIQVQVKAKHMYVSPLSAVVFLWRETFRGASTCRIVDTTDVAIRWRFYWPEDFAGFSS